MKRRTGGEMTAFLFEVVLEFILHTMEFMVDFFYRRRKAARAQERA
jgi:hypothetical protein